MEEIERFLNKSGDWMIRPESAIFDLNGIQDVHQYDFLEVMLL